MADLSNPGWSDRWTCPACLTDLPQKREGDHVCQCGMLVRCTLTSQPVCESEIITCDEEE